MLRTVEARHKHDVVTGYSKFEAFNRSISQINKSILLPYFNATVLL